MDSKNLSQNAGLEWNNSYLMGIPVIDKQHQHFLELFNQLLALIPDVNKTQQLSKIIDELESYTHYHFNMEENLMQKASFSETEVSNHRMQHQVFVKKVEEFQIASKYNNVVLSEQLIHFLQKWFLTHIKVVDKKYADTLKTFLNENKDYFIS
jgi:hemerythrin-like metal-binding protein